MATLRPKWSAGLPDPNVVQAATDAIGGHFVLAESVSHPIVVSQAIELAYLLSAYGLVACEPERAAATECSDRSRSTLAHRPAELTN